MRSIRIMGQLILKLPIFIIANIIAGEAPVSINQINIFIN